MVNSRVQPSEETPGLSIHFLDDVLLRIKAFHCDEVNSLMSSLAVCALVPYLENHCLTQVMSSPKFYSFISYISAGNPFWLNIYMWYEAGVQLHSFTHGCPVVPAHFTEGVSLPTEGSSWKLQRFIFELSFLLHTPSHMQARINCLAYRGRAVGFKIGSVSPPTLFFFKFFWLFWIPCILHEFQDWLANFCNKGSWDSDRGCLEPADQLSEHWNFMDIKLSDYEYGMLFYLLGFLWFLSMMFVTFTVQVLTSFVKLIPSNLILFDSTVNGIFLISFLRIFYYITLHQVIRKSFRSSFPTWWLFPPSLTVLLMLICKILCISSLKMPFHTNRYCRILVLINRHGFNGNYLLLRRHL